MPLMAPISTVAVAEAPLPRPIASVMSTAADVYPEPKASTVTDVIISVAVAVAPVPPLHRVDSGCHRGSPRPGRTSTRTRDVHDDAGDGHRGPRGHRDAVGLDTHDVPAGLDAVGVVRQVEVDGRHRVAAAGGGRGVTASTPPNAVAVAPDPVPSPDSAMVTCGWVYPAPAASTLIAVTDPVGVKVAVAEAPVPAPVMSTVGADVYPLPGSVIVMPVMAPLAPTVAVAVAPLPSPRDRHVASGRVSGLLA